MLCTAPITIQREWDGRLHSDKPIVVRCKQCLNCRIRAKATWTGRALMEASTSEYSTFLTLTYESELKRTAPLDLRDLQLFWKRLREKSQTKIRYLACGEYGTRSGMAHWHAIMFHDSPIDQKTVENAWKQGFVYMGDVNEKSVGYVAKYTLKQQDEKIVTYSSKPAIALRYLDMLGSVLSFHRFTIPCPTQIRLNGRLYPLDAWSQQQLVKLSGGKVVEVEPLFGQEIHRQEQREIAGIRGEEMEKRWLASETL